LDNSSKRELTIEEANPNLEAIKNLAKTKRKSNQNYIKLLIKGLVIQMV